ncbi:MAG: bifunctional UDP-N-acetylglucosamine diphosphorylase/glucosamine-1-phosphate N-acetyltransferase GlmU [Alphaproteobacteria bacterium]
MPQTPVAVIILAAGMGTRMKSARPKVLHPVGGLPLVGHVIAVAETLAPEKIAVVIGPEMDDLAQAVSPCPTAVQTDRLGTADAFKAARHHFEDFHQGTILVLLGDTAFLDPAALAALTEKRDEGNAVVVLGIEPHDPGSYGRMIVDADTGELREIVEVAGRDDVRSVGLCNTGVMAFDASLIWDLVDQIGNDNPKGEFYLTDIVAVARKAGHRCAHIVTDSFQGIDSRIGLAQAEVSWQDSARRAAMEGGATLLDPATTYFSFDTVIGRDVIISQNVVIGPGVTIADNVRIEPFCHLEHCVIEEGAVIGPFARLRGGARVGEGAKIGTFVESKNGTFGKGSKTPHLSYVGDAEVGAGANVGAGVITCNYDGVLKHKTIIGDGAFVGSNSSLVAPVTIGARALIGAGSVISKDVAPDAIATTRAPQKEIPGAATKRRERLQKIKDTRNGHKG